MLALLYARVSTRHLQDDNFSIETQLPAMRKLATELGATNLMEFVEYESAFDEGLTRTELNRLLEWVRKSGGDLLIFYSSDRFTRDIADGVILRRELYKLGIKLYCCYPFPQEVRSENELVNILTDWQSQQYVEKLREASMRGYKGKLESGAFSQGTAPYGYRIEGERHDSHLVPALPQAEIVQMIFSWFVLEDYTTRQIAQKLTDMGLPTPGEHINRSRKRPSGKWAPTTVYSILYEEVYAGIWYGHRIMKVGKNKFALRPRSEWIPIAVEPLVPREMWQAAQEKLQARRHNRNAKRNYLMGRRLYCGCGYSFVGGFRTRKRKGVSFDQRYYHCTAKDNVGGNCGTPSVDAELLEGKVWQWVIELISNPRAVLEGYRSAQAQTERQHENTRKQLALLDEQIVEQGNKLERLLDLYIEGGFPKDVLNARRVEYEGILSKLNHQRGVLARQLAEVTISDERIESIASFVATVNAKIGDFKDADEATKRTMIDALDLTGTVKVEDGKRVLYLKWCLKEFPLLLDTGSGIDNESGGIKMSAGTR